MTAPSLRSRAGFEGKTSADVFIPCSPLRIRAAAPPSRRRCPLRCRCRRTGTSTPDPQDPRPGGFRRLGRPVRRGRHSWRLPLRALGETRWPVAAAGLASCRDAPCAAPRRIGCCGCTRVNTRVVANARTADTGTAVPDTRHTGLPGKMGKAGRSHGGVAGCRDDRRTPGCDGCRVRWPVPVRSNPCSQDHTASVANDPSIPVGIASWDQRGMGPVHAKPANSPCERLATLFGPLVFPRDSAAPAGHQAGSARSCHISAASPISSMCPSFSSRVMSLASPQMALPYCLPKRNSLDHR